MGNSIDTNSSEGYRIVKMALNSPAKEVTTS